MDANIMKNIWMHRILSQKSRLLRLLLIGVFTVIHVSSVRAQATSSISGRVEDASGAAVPSAALTVTSMETSSTRTAMTDGSGEYRVLSLPVGRYEVKAEKTGFQVGVRQGLNLVVGEEAVVNMTLGVGEVSQPGRTPCAAWPCSSSGERGPEWSGATNPGNARGVELVLPPYRTGAVARRGAVSPTYRETPEGSIGSRE